MPDYGASTSGFKARLCHLIFYLSGIECCSTKILATATHPTLLWAPIFHQQEDKDNGFTFFNAGVFAESSLRKQAWRNPKEGRVGCLHQNIFTRKVTDIAFTSDFCNNYSYSASPVSPYLTSPRPRPSSQVPLSCPSSLKSLVSRPQVPSPKSPHARPDVPVPLSPSHFYTQPPTCKLNLRHTWKSTAVQPEGKNLVRQKELAWNLYTVWHKFLENTKQPNSSSFLTYFMISVTDANLPTHAELKTYPN